jgi:hypothetical protein
MGACLKSWACDNVMARLEFGRGRRARFARRSRPQISTRPRPRPPLQRHYGAGAPAVSPQPPPGRPSAPQPRRRRRRRRAVRCTAAHPARCPCAARPDASGSCSRISFTAIGVPCAAGFLLGRAARPRVLARGLRRDGSALRPGALGSVPPVGRARVVAGTSKAAPGSWCRAMRDAARASPDSAGGSRRPLSHRAAT